MIQENVGGRKDYKIDLVIGGEGVTLDWVYDVKNKLKKGFF